MMVMAFQNGIFHAPQLPAALRGRGCFFAFGVADWRSSSSATGIRLVRSMGWYIAPANRGKALLALMATGMPAWDCRPPVEVGPQAVSSFIKQRPSAAPINLGTSERPMAAKVALLRHAQRRGRLGHPGQPALDILLVLVPARRPPA